LSDGLTEQWAVSAVNDPAAAEEGRQEGRAEGVSCLPSWPTDPTGDPGLKLWQLSRLLLPSVPSGGRVLEIGYRDTQWASLCKRADPSLSVTAIDWRPVTKPQEGVALEQGDILTRDYPLSSFDLVVGLSSFEHVGLGHYELDPLDDLGDVRCLRRARSWLKPEGFIYFDVPYRPEGYFVKDARWRAYDDQAIRERFGNVTVLGYTTASVHGWIEKPTTPATVLKPYYYVALVARKGDGTAN
jgi:SAM-dependent methyltransferase